MSEKEFYKLKVGDEVKSSKVGMKYHAVNLKGVITETSNFLGGHTMMDSNTKKFAYMTVPSSWDLVKKGKY